MLYALAQHNALATMFLSNFFIGLILTRYWLRSKLMPQPVRVEKIKAHRQKKGTPTMGGVIFWLILPISSCLLIHPSYYFKVFWSFWLFIGAIGAWDDYHKIKKQQHRGVPGYLKLAMTLLATLLFLWQSGQANVTWQMFQPSLVHLSTTHFLLWSILAIAGSVHAVNLTDGLDGLAASCLVMLFLWLLMLAIIESNQHLASLCGFIYEPCAQQWVVILVGIIALLIAFLMVNVAPAQIFMGDVGALSLGALLSTASISLHVLFWLPIVAFIPVIEAVSVILQVGSFKATGKRVLRMAPIHHHFEMLGWSESKIVGRFLWLTLLAIIAASLLLWPNHLSTIPMHTTAIGISHSVLQKPLL